MITSRVRADLVRRAERERLAEVEHLDALADAEDDAHVVLHEQHAAAERRRGARRSSRRAAGSPRRRGPRPARRAAGSAARTATARAMPTRRSSPCGSADAARLAMCRRPRLSSSSSARDARALRRDEPGAERAELDVLEHRQVRERSRRPGTCGRAPPWRSRCGGQDVTSRPPRITCPGGARDEAARRRS